MKSAAEVEQILERLGNAWPADRSLAEDVLRRIESEPVHLKSRTVRLPAMKSFLAMAASVAVVAALWCTGRNDNTLYAQAIDAIHRARTFHMTTTVQPAANEPAQPVMESWYERGVGFRETVGPEVRLGNQAYFWTYVTDSKLAIRSASHGINEIVDRMLDNEILKALKDTQGERYAEGDQVVDGQPCRAYLLTKLARPADPEPTAGQKRVRILLDGQSRIVRAFRETQSDDRWVVQFTSDWKYDVPIDRSLFEPHFSNDVKIVDADSAFDEFVDLDKAIYREERDGLWYAIHRVERCENGGIFVASSVRGTAETLRKYPLTRVRLQPGLFFTHGPAVNYDASPQGNGYFRIDLAQAGHNGIDVRWWVLVPRGTPPTYFDVAPGKIKLPVGISPRGEFAKAHFADERGVIHHLTWDVELDVPQPQSLPTLDAIAAKVYADQLTLEAVPFGSLDMGTKDHVRQFSNPRKTTAAEFSKAVVADVRRWMESDVEFQLEGQFAISQAPGADAPKNEAADNPAMGFMYNPLVDDATLARVAQHPSLKRLYLNGTNVTDAGLRHIQGLKELHALSLANTGISDAGLQDLEGLSALRNLDVQNTKVTAGGAARLQAAIPGLKIKR